jgi:uncharacterized membrane protein
MDECESSAVTRLIVGSAVYILVVAVAALMLWGWEGSLLAGGVILIIGSPIIGACVIWSVVRWTNYRDDPQSARRPVEPLD